MVGKGGGRGVGRETRVEGGVPCQNSIPNPNLEVAGRTGTTPAEDGTGTAAER